MTTPYVTREALELHLKNNPLTVQEPPMPLPEFMPYVHDNLTDATRVLMKLHGLQIVLDPDDGSFLGVEYVEDRLDRLHEVFTSVADPDDKMHHYVCGGLGVKTDDDMDYNGTHPLWVIDLLKVWLAAQ